MSYLHFAAEWKVLWYPVEGFRCCVCTMQWQLVLILIIWILIILTFWGSSRYYFIMSILRIDRFPCVLGENRFLVLWFLPLLFQLRHGRPQNLFQAGGNVKILLILFRLLTMQWKWTFTERSVLSTALICAGWTLFLNLLSEMFSTLAIRNAFSFHKLPNIHFFEHFLQISHNLRIKATAKTTWEVIKQQVGHSCKTVSSNEKQNYMLTRLSDNSELELKLEHRALAQKYWADELRKLATANIALHLLLTKTSELNLEGKDVFPQVCIDVF